MAEEDGISEAVYENQTWPDQRIISQKDGQITERMATYLNPTAKTLDEAVAIPNTPLLSELLPPDHQQWPSTVIFRGWRHPQKRWKEWVDRLEPKYAPIWVQAGIYNGIMSSVFEIRCSKELVLGLSEHWCSKTNSFVFPWGEATITLEDVMILGGYSVCGESVASPSGTEELTLVHEELRKYRRQVQRGRENKASQGGWMRFFMDKTRKYEHAAFLSLWLSRFLFHPSSEDLIGKTVFPIAAKLSQGIKVALAPAVLASIYRDLRKLSEEAMASNSKITVVAPFQLLQIWALERFPILVPISLQPGEPRVARWHKLNPKLKMPKVRAALKSAQNFLWRPYAADVKNWKHLPYYKDSEQLLDSSSVDENEELLCFLQVLHDSKLVGLECEEKYLPHRVGMQFGMDQDLPGEFSNIEVTRKFVDFYIPPRTFQPGVTARYRKWWNNTMAVRKNAMKDVLLKKMDSLFPANQKNGFTDDGASCPINPKGNSDLITPDIPFNIRNQIVQDWSDDGDDEHTCTGTAILLSQSKELITLSSSESSDSEDSYDDHAPIATCFRKPRHSSPTAAPPKSDEVAASSRKRKLSARNEETSQKEVTFQSSVKAAAKRVKGGESGESTETFCFGREVKTDQGGCFVDGGTTDPCEENELHKDVLLKKMDSLFPADQKNGFTGDDASCPINPEEITPDIPFNIRNQIVQDWSDDDDDLHPVRANISHSDAVFSSQSKEPIIILSSSESIDSEDSYDDFAPITTCFREPHHSSSPIAAPPKSDAVAASSRKESCHPEMKELPRKK